MAGGCSGAVAGGDVQSRAALERLKGEYEKSSAVLAPILRYLQTTDALTDQIVYRLYRLTDEKFARVARAKL